MFGNTLHNLVRSEFERVYLFDVHLGSYIGWYYDEIGRNVFIECNFQEDIHPDAKTIFDWDLHEMVKKGDLRGDLTWCKPPDDISIEDITKHPFHWTTIVHPSGLVGTGVYNTDYYFSLDRIQSQKNRPTVHNAINQRIPIYRGPYPPPDPEIVQEFVFEQFLPDVFISDDLKGIGCHRNWTPDVCMFSILK